MPEATPAPLVEPEVNPIPMPEPLPTETPQMPEPQALATSAPEAEQALMRLPLKQRVMRKHGACARSSQAEPVYAVDPNAQASDSGSQVFYIVFLVLGGAALCLLWSFVMGSLDW